MKSSTITTGIGIVLLALFLMISPEALSAEDLFKSDDQMMKDALVQVKTDLIQKLKEKGHEGLADKLSDVNPKKIGDFLGSAAGGDFDQAFNIAGSSAANYLYDKFTEKLNDKLGDLIQPNSPAAIIGKYIPLDPVQAKQIAIKALKGDYSAAGEQLTGMVKSEGGKNLEQLSKDIVSGGIDWVLKPTVGAGAGNLFIKLVELEMAGIEWFKKWSTDYLTEDRRNKYNNLRKQGMTPKQALADIMDQSLSTAFARYPFHGDEDKALDYLENQYARSRGITPDTLKAKRQAEAERIAIALSLDLEKQKEEYDKKLKQELLKIFIEVAKNNEQLKKLIAGLKGARDKIDAIKAETEKMKTFWKKYKNVLDVTKMEERKRVIEKKLTELEKGAKGSGLEKCNEIDGWLEQIEEKLDAIDTLLERIREIGRECQEIVKKICENKDDKAIIKKGMVALKKRFGYIGAKRREMKTHKIEAITNLDKLKELKGEVKALLDKQQEVQSALNQIDKWKELLKTVQKNVDTPTEAVKKLHADIRKIVDDPIFKSFKGKKDSIRYTLLRDASEAKKEFDQQKGEVETAIQKMSESLNGFDGVKEKLEVQRQALDQALDECRKLQDFDTSQYQRRIRQMEQKDGQYKNGFKKLNHKAKTCAGETDDTLSSDSLDEARRLLDKARERGGVVIDNFIVADNAKKSLVGMQASAAAALAFVSTPAANASELITACGQAQAKNKQLQSEIQSATAASAGHMASLKKSYEAAANARKKACEEAKAAANTKDQQQCEQAVAQAQTQASNALEAAQAATEAAGKMKSLYNQLKSKSELKTFDELLRKIPAAIQSLKDHIANASSKLADIDADSIGQKIEQAQTAANNANDAAQKVSGLVGQIRGLLAGIDSALDAEAEKIRSEAEGVISELATRRNKMAGEAAVEAKAAGEKAAAQIKDAKAKIKELSASLESLNKCRNADMGGDLNELRTNSDMGEIFGPAAKADADNAGLCATLAANNCKDEKEACKANEEHNDAGNCVCKKGYVPDANGKCVDPFDENHSTSMVLSGLKNEQRNQENAQQTITDQMANKKRDGFTSDDLDKNIDDTQTFVGTECNDRKPCPAGQKCEDGKCVDKHDDCSKPEDCPEGYECKDGKCVKKSGTKPKSLAISPANKAVKINEPVTLKAILKNEDGTTKDITQEAAWTPGNPFSKGEIGQYTVKATYQNLSGTAMITVVKEKGMDDISVNSKTITVTFFDHGKEDGDMIDILINGKAVFSGIRLTKAPQSRTITMNADVVVFGFRALNVGKIPPNTATVTFTSVVKGKSKQKYELKKNQKTNMNITYAP